MVANVDWEEGVTCFYSWLKNVVFVLVRVLISAVERFSTYMVQPCMCLLAPCTWTSCHLIDQTAALVTLFCDSVLQGRDYDDDEGYEDGFEDGGDDGPVF